MQPLRVSINISFPSLYNPYLYHNNCCCVFLFCIAFTSIFFVAECSQPHSAWRQLTRVALRLSESDPSHLLAPAIPHPYLPERALQSSTTSHSFLSSIFRPF